MGEEFSGLQCLSRKHPAMYYEKQTFMEEDTSNIVHRTMSPLQSRHLGTSHSSPRISSTVQNTLQNPLLELPSAVPLYFPESHRQTENSSLSKVLLVL